MEPTASEMVINPSVRRSNKSCDLEPQTDDFDLNINWKRTKNESRVPHWWFSIATRRSQVPLSSSASPVHPKQLVWMLQKQQRCPAPQPGGRCRHKRRFQLYNRCIFEHKVCFCNTKSSTAPVIFKHGDKLRYLQSKYYERG